MSSHKKFWVWLLILTLPPVWGAKWAYSNDMLVEHSIAYEKNRAPLKDLSGLFSALGIDNGATDRLNPCLELEENTRRYCTPHGLRLLLHEHTFVPVEDQLLNKFLNGKDTCGQVAQYIGQVCELNNFRKIIKHFALEK